MSGSEAVQEVIGALDDGGITYMLVGSYSTDVRDVIAVQGDHIDLGYVHGWCERHGTRALLDEIRASIPPI